MAALYGRTLHGWFRAVQRKLLDDWLGTFINGPSCICPGRNPGKARQQDAQTGSSIETALDRDQERAGGTCIVFLGVRAARACSLPDWARHDLIGGPFVVVYL
jgi:hypothetical protein